MKTLFLLTVLFVLLAFAFKAPEQSAWDFAKEVGTNVSHKMAANDGVEVRPELGRDLERRVKRNFSEFEQRLRNAEKGIQAAGNSSKSTVPETSQPRLPSPKPRPVVKTKTAAADPNHMSAATQAPDQMPKISISPGPRLPARPVPKVASKPLAKPAARIVPSRPAILIDSEELAEAGARFDRASRLLSEIK